jgi:hypothetical protein
VRALATALLLVASSPALAERLVTFAQPVLARESRPKLCRLADGVQPERSLWFWSLPEKDLVCGGLDEDGLLPLRIVAPRGATVWLGDELMRRDRSGIVRLDPLSLVSRLTLHQLDPRSRDAAPVVQRELRADGAGYGRDETVTLYPDAALRQVVLARVAREAAGPMVWAAAYDAGAAGPHPVLVVYRFSGAWKGRTTNDLGRSVAAPEMEPAEAALGDVELVAAVDIDPRLLGRCQRCALGDFGWPEVEFRCLRSRMDATVRLHVARTGKLLETRTFRGVEPGACGENVSHLQVRGGTSPDLYMWLRELGKR